MSCSPRHRLCPPCAALVWDPGPAAAASPRHRPLSAPVPGGPPETSYACTQAGTKGQTRRESRQLASPYIRSRDRFRGGVGAPLPRAPPRRLPNVAAHGRSANLTRPKTSILGHRAHVFAPQEHLFPMHATLTREPGAACVGQVSKPESEHEQKLRLPLAEYRSSSESPRTWM